jgi:hypothetical protein
LWWSLESRLPQVFAISLSIENFLVSGSYCQSNKEGVFVKSLSCIASGILLNPNSGYVQAEQARCYANARKLAAAETGLALATFPEICPYPLPTLLTEGFLPD